MSKISMKFVSVHAILIILLCAHYHDKINVTTTNSNDLIVY